MVNLRNADHGTSDFYLQIDEGRKYGFKIASHPDTGFGYRPGWTKMLVPPIRQDGFNYQHVSPEYDVMLAYDSWVGGCGWVDDPDLSNLYPTIYSFSRGVDASWGDRLYLSPAEQSATLPNAVAIDYYADTSIGTFASAGRYLYKMDTSTTTWVQKVDLGSGKAFTGPVVEFSGAVFAPAGDSDAYQYSTDGDSWTASNAVDPYAYKFIARGRTSTTPQFWKISSTGNLKVATDPRNSGSGWGSAVPVGHTSETVNSLVVANDKIWVFKKEGIFSYDGSTVRDEFKSEYLVSQNGKHAYLWADGNIYAPYGDNLMAFNPYDSTFGFLWPSLNMVGHPEINGTIRGITGDVNDLYIMIRNKDSVEYLMKYSGRTRVWHSIAHDATLTSDAIKLVGPSRVHSANPVILRSAGTTSTYYILPRKGSRPEDDLNCRYVTTGYIVGVNSSVGALTIPKNLTAGRLLVQNSSASKTVDLYYSLDNDTNTLLMQAVGNGLNQLDIHENTEFSQIRYRIDLTTGTNRATPVCLSAGYSTIVLPIRRRLWSIDVITGNNLPQSGGGDMLVSGKALRTFLDQAFREHIHMYDRDGRQYVVRILEASPNGTYPLSEDDAIVYTLDIVEINSVHEDLDPWVWTRDAWGSLKPWGDS